MIVYQNTIKNFKNDVLLNKISDILLQMFRERHISGGNASEINSWNNSLRCMKDVLELAKTPDDCNVAIEYKIPQTSKRVDFMVLGKDDRNNDHIVIIELKQWGKAKKVDEVSKYSVDVETKNESQTKIRGDLRFRGFTTHPSYQAYTYKSLILNYCAADDVKEDSLNPCAYLHNLDDDYREDLENQIYSEWINEAPVFLKKDVEKIAKYINTYIKAKSDKGDLLYKIDFGRIKPTKSLQDSLDSMLCGNEEFKMVDEQAVAFDYIMRAIKKAQNDLKKHVLVIVGGPGTGKSVLAINVLAKTISKMGLNAAYITKNMAPRNCYADLLSKGNAKKAVDLKLAIRSPYCLPLIKENGIDVGIFDEAHRMAMKPYMYKGSDMLDDAIKACKVSIFFIDEDQRITTKDVYGIDEIYKCATANNAIIETPEPYELTSQFRCNGSDAYLMFINDLLAIKVTANDVIDRELYDFRVFDTPEELKKALINADNCKNKSRMCAGYCYDWNVKYNRGEYDVIIGDFKAKWNLVEDETFAINPNSINEIGCIHTVQGMEFDYVGVIIGKDLIYRDGKVQTNKLAISKDDKTSGIRGCKDEKLADRLIRNTYKVLLTRGQKGCFVFCEDKALAEYIKSRIK